MFQSSMTIIRDLYLYLTKVIFMLKHSVKLRHLTLDSTRLTCQSTVSLLPCLFANFYNLYLYLFIICFNLKHTFPLHTCCHIT